MDGSLDRSASDGPIVRRVNAGQSRSLEIQDGDGIRSLTTVSHDSACYNPLHAAISKSFLLAFNF